MSNESNAVDAGKNIVSEDAITGIVAQEIVSLAKGRDREFEIASKLFELSKEHNVVFDSPGMLIASIKRSLHKIEDYAMPKSRTKRYYQLTNKLNAIVRHFGSPELSGKWAKLGLNVKAFDPEDTAESWIKAHAKVATEQIKAFGEKVVELVTVETTTLPETAEVKA